MQHDDWLLISLLLLKEVACLLMLAYVSLDACGQLRHLLHRRRQSDWQTVCDRVRALLVVGGPLLFTVFHIADINHLMT